MMHTHTHKYTHTYTSLEALMNLDVIGSEAELKGAGQREREMGKERGRPRESEMGKLCFQ